MWIQPKEVIQLNRNCTNFAQATHSNFFEVEISGEIDT